MQRIEADADESDMRVCGSVLRDGFVSKQVDVFKETLERGCWCVLFTCLPAQRCQTHSVRPRRSPPACRLICFRVDCLVCLACLKQGRGAFEMV
ncbi:hypothetical protein MHYP_G00127990 [Metynnis hypsauchen]